jgi:type IV fimbrial biogenesis protein FimT
MRRAPQFGVDAVSGRPSRSQGFSLLELLIVIAVIGLLFSMIQPTFQQWIANTQVRNRAESFHVGLRTAQVEALKRNAPVDFIMTAMLPVGATSASTMPSSSGSTSGSNWIVQQDPTSSSGSSTLFIMGNKANTSANSVQIDTSFDTGFSGVVQFNGLGRMNIGSPTPVSLTPIPTAAPLKFVFSSSNANANLTLWITVTAGGQLRECQKLPALPAGDPQGC